MPRVQFAKAKPMTTGAKLRGRKNEGPIKKITRNKWYPFNVTKVRRKPNRIPRLRTGLTPGTVVILLTGPYRGKRVVFLKQLQRSGLIAVTGPLALNGCPLRRVCQKYVIVTSSKIDIGKLNTEKLNDNFFNKKKPDSERWKNWPQRKRQIQLKKLRESRKKLGVTKIQMQLNVDNAILEELKGERMMKRYLGSYFSIIPGQPPHAIKF